jgi:hypothetical protein
MARIITRELADNIVEKLDAQIEHGRKHDVAYVYHDGKMIAHFGIRRGSEKDQGHDHIPHCLHYSPSDTKELGICKKYKTDWLENMRKKGFI